MALDTLARAMAAHADSKAKTAYQYAVEGGYTGTEEEFEAEVALMAENAQAVNNAVRFDISQSKTDAQKLQAQANLGLDTSEGSLQEQIDERAKIDGSYDTLGSGTSNNLNTAIKVFDEAAYTSRTICNGADVGNKFEMRKIIYGSVVHNQLIDPVASATIQSTISLTSDITGKFTITGTATSPGGRLVNWSNQTFPVVKGHKYLLKSDFIYNGFYSPYISNSNNTSNYFRFYSTSHIAEATFTGDAKFGTNITADHEYNDTGYLVIVDLTQYFGSSTIADNAYAMEQSEAGSGIAWLQYYGFFRKPYYAFNAGTLMSSNPSKHTNVNRNLFNKNTSSEWLSGNAGSDGVYNSNAYMRSAIIPCLPNTTYRIEKSKGERLSAASYATIPSNGDKGTYNLTTIENGKYVQVITGANDYYLVVYFYNANTDTGLTPQEIADTLVVWVHWDTDYDDDPYADYEEWTYPIDSTVDGHGIFKLNTEDNSIYVDGDELTPDGTFTDAWGISALKDLSWARTQTSGEYYFRAKADSNYTANAQAEVYGWCSAYIVKGMGKATDATLPADGEIAFNCSVMGSGNTIVVRDDSITTTSELITKLTNKGDVIFKKASSTTSEKDPYTKEQVCDDWGIQYWTDYAEEQGNRDVAIPVGHESVYPVNLRSKLEMLPDNVGINGKYVYEHTDNGNVWSPLQAEVPAVPTSTDGTFTLKATVSSGTATLSWVAET